MRKFTSIQSQFSVFSFQKFLLRFVLFSLWGFEGLGIGAFAQVFPVQMTPVFTSPYSSKISDYATSLDTRFQLIINPTDIAINSRQVRLKMYISGNSIEAQTSDFVTGLNPIFINGGEIQTLTNVDLAGLFRLENLQGLSNVQYANPLPEGNYNICFEMFDFVTNQKISRKSCTNLYLILNDPPILNIPARNEQIVVSEFPNILFTWTPRSINATNVSYRFELKLLQDPSIDPQFGFAISPTVLDETQFGTTLLYDTSKPALIPGKRYAWRVRAISTGGLSENSVFKNDGYSEIFWFTYASNCPAPIMVFSEIVGSKSVKITWQSNIQNTKYQVQYRKRTSPNPSQGGGYEWFSTYTLNTQTTITDLDVATDYEFRVGATCEPTADPSVPYTFSGINNFSTPAAGSTTTSAYSCGLNPAVNIANQTPLTNLIVSETFKAGDFPVKVLELTGSNPYAGKGFVTVPYLADTRIAVEFNNITINTNYQLINGVVETTYNPAWNNVNSNTNSDSSSNNNEPTTTEEIVNFPIGSSNNIQVNTQQGTITITGTNGQNIVVNINSQYETTTIIDKNGVTYAVNNTTGAVTTSSQLQEVVTAVEQNIAELKFKYKDTDFLHKDKLATMLHGKILKIEIINKNQDKPLDIEKTKIKLGSSNLTLIKENGKFFVNVKADSNTLSKTETELEIMDSLAKKTIAKLKIIKYFAPIVKFKKPDNYNGDFLFDDGFERHTTLKLPAHYSTFTVGKNNQTYYTPVVGLKTTQVKTIKIDLTDFESIAKKDPDFKLVIKPSINNKIRINTLDSLVVNANELNLLKEIQIEAIGVIEGSNLTAMFIECKIKESEQKVGQIEYYCALPIRKSIRLIYTKFSDETSFPSPYNPIDLQNFLNRNSHNQLFIEYTVTSENFDVPSSTKSAFMTSKNTLEALYLGLLNLKYATASVPIVDWSYLPLGFNNANDFYFITNLEKEKFAPDGTTSIGFIGGGHFPRVNGGLFLKTPGSAYNETNLETDSHEFGHWVGLPHTFEERNDDGTIRTKPARFFTVHTNQGESEHNFMDYKIKRKTFFKFQLLNRETTSN